MANFASIIYRNCFCKISKYYINRYIHTTNKLNVSAFHDTNIIREILFAPIQSEKDKKPRKISIIGAGGNIGQLMAYELVLKRISDEIVLCELPEKKGKMCGIGIDLLDGTSYAMHPKIKVCINCEHTNDSDLIVIAAGLGVKKGASRLDVLKVNADNFKTLIPLLARLSPKSIILVVSNPVDIMTYAAWKFSGFPINRILGTGTSLDTSRFKIMLSKKLGISPKSITAYILGEHGQSCLAAWSTINVAGTRLRDCKGCFGLKDDPECWFELEKQVKEQANLVKKFKGFTSYAISMVVSEIAEAIIMDKRTVHPVTTCCNGICGLKMESWFSLPCVVGNKGVHHIIEQKLDKVDLAKLHKSAAVLDKALKTYNWGGEQKKGEQKKEKLRQCN